jgi:hypothetical protein
MGLGAIFRPGMRAYFIPLGAGIVLALSAFLPWVIVGDVPLTGVPDTPALWVAGLGAMAAVLALLSLITRKNSRHPLLLVGLVALGITFLSWRVMPVAASERALTARKPSPSSTERRSATRRRRSRASVSISGWPRPRYLSALG